MQLLKSTSSPWRWVLLAVVIGFATGFTLPLVKQGVLLPNLMKIASPTLGVVTIGLLVSAAVITSRRMFTCYILGVDLRTRKGWFNLVFGVVVSGLAIAILCVGVLTVINRGWGRTVRAADWLSALPYGNLFYAGGYWLEGWSYFAVLVGLAACVYWNTISNRFKQMKQGRGVQNKHPKDRRPNSRDRKESDAPRRKGDTVLQDEESLEYLGRMFQDSPSPRSTG